MTPNLGRHDRAHDDVTLDRSKAEFVDLVSSADGPAVARVAATLDVEVAPLTAYATLADESEYSFLLESAEKVASSDPAGAFAPTPDAASADRHARFSFVGYDPDAVVTVTPDGTEVDTCDDRVADLLTPGDGDVVDQLRGTLPDVERLGFPESDRQHLDGGLVGFLAYDAVYDLWLDEVGVERSEATDSESDGSRSPSPTSESDGSKSPSPTSLPDAQFVLTTKTLVFDESDGTLSLVCTPLVHPDDDAAAVYDDVVTEASRVAAALADADEPETGGFSRTDEAAGPQDEYEEAVRKAKQHVLDGDIYQGVISRKRELTGEIDTLGFYEALRAVNPSPYMYLLQHGDRSIVGASPETLVSVQGRRIVSNPIAGTCARGNSPVEDRRLAGEMLADAKERSEHTMLVDLARNDVRRVSEAGSVRVEEFMNVLKYSHVQHIESTVTGTLDSSYDAFDATRAAFPAGTLSGAPKVRAMEIIDDLENSSRGVYGGGVGYYSWTGDADFAIVIRTATIDHSVQTDRGLEDRITVQAGAGIVADSDPTKEYEETEKKMGGVLAAIDRLEEDQ